MNEISEYTVINESVGDDILQEIDTLRSSIEQNHRFRSGFFGYRKKDVKKYLSALIEQYEKLADMQEHEIKKLKEEKSALYEIAADHKEKLDAAVEEERIKLQTEYGIREGLIESLREQNSKLISENQEKQIEIASLNEQITGFRSIASARSKQMDALSERLDMLLNTKFKECSDVISAWKAEFHGVVDNEEKQVSEL